MAPLWVALSWKGSDSTQVTDATRSGVNVRLEQSAYQSEGECSQYIDSAKNNKDRLCSWLLSEWHLRKRCTGPKFQIPPLMLRNVFHFQCVSFVSHHALIRMMLLHTRGPRGKNCESDRPALQGKPVDSQCLFFPHILPLFLDGPYIIITRWPLLRPLDQLLLTHSGENRAAEVDNQIRSEQEEATF